MKLIDAKVGRPAEVLLVEDNDDDVVLTREGFESSKISINLHHVPHGEACMNFLRHSEGYEYAPVPDLILLDLNMPIMNGREVLSAMASDPKLSRIPVVILTTSREERDILDLYQLRCSSYIVKPVDFVQFQRVIEEIGNYWFSVVVLPGGFHECQPSE